MKIAPPRSLHAKLKLQKTLAANLLPHPDGRWRVIVYQSRYGWCARAHLVRHLTSGGGA